MKQVFKIGNSEELNTTECDLLMEIGESHVCFGILDHSTKTLLQSGYFTTEEKDNGDILQNIFEQNAELRSPFHQTVVGYYMTENVLIPSKFYFFEKTKSILQAMYDGMQNIVISESIPGWQMYNTYHVPAAIHEFINRKFAGGNFWHAHSVALKNGLPQREEGNLMVNFKTDSFSVMVTKGNSLLLAQIYPYINAEDVLYFLLKICKQLSLSQNDVSLILSGLINYESAVYKGLYQYFVNLQFALPDDGIRLSESFSEYPVHFFSSIFKLALCVL